MYVSSCFHWSPKAVLWRTGSTRTNRVKVNAAYYVVRPARLCHLWLFSVNLLSGTLKIDSFREFSVSWSLLMFSCGNCDILTCPVTNGSTLIFLSWLYTSCVTFENTLHVTDYKLLVRIEITIGLYGIQVRTIAVVCVQQILYFLHCKQLTCRSTLIYTKWWMLKWLIFIINIMKLPN